MDTNYTKQAQDFLDKTNTTLDIQYIGHGPFWDDDKESRDIYRFTLKRDGRQYSSKFGQSIVNSGSASDNIAYNPKAKTPFRYGESCVPSKADILGKRKASTAYDILSCLTTSDPGTFEDFCGEYGYDTDSRKAEKTYFAVQKEWEGVRRLWNEDEREQLADIQ